MTIRPTEAKAPRAVRSARVVLSRQCGLSAAIAIAVLALAAPGTAQAQTFWGAQSAVAAAGEEALPGEGRPPSPGPTSPNNRAVS